MNLAFFNDKELQEPVTAAGQVVFTGGLWKNEVDRVPFAPAIQDASSPFGQFSGALNRVFVDTSGVTGANYFIVAYVGIQG